MSKGKQEKQTAELDLCECQILKLGSESMKLHMGKMFKELEGGIENMNKEQNTVK